MLSFFDPFLDATRDLVVSGESIASLAHKVLIILMVWHFLTSSEINEVEYTLFDILNSWILEISMTMEGTSLMPNILDDEPEQSVASGTLMIHASCCVVTIKFTDLENFHAFLIVINNHFFETLHKEVTLLWILTDRKTVTKLLKVC